jgi:hypothetical protein
MCSVHVARKQVYGEVVVALVVPRAPAEAAQLPSTAASSAMLQGQAGGRGAANYGSLAVSATEESANAGDAGCFVASLRQHCAERLAPYQAPRKCAQNPRGRAIEQTSAGSGYGLLMATHHSC